MDDNTKKLKQQKVTNIIQEIVKNYGEESVTLIKEALQKCGYSFCGCRRKNENTD